MERIKKGWFNTPKKIRQLLVLIAGVAIVIVGLILLAIPGPGWLTIFIGLAVLSTEFKVAEDIKLRVEKRVRQAADKAAQKAKGMRKKR